MQQDFTAEAERERARNQRHARLNHHAALAALALSAIASFLAAVLIALDAPKAAVVALSALPGALLVLNATLRLDAKARWHYRKVHDLDAILRAVRYEGLDPAEASRRLSDLQERMERSYPGFEASAPTITAAEPGGHPRARP